MTKRQTRDGTSSPDNSITRLQCSQNSANTPAKAWRQIFTESLLNKIVTYTNEYGVFKANEWINIDKGNLMDFILVLFIARIQKRNDAPYKWFSNDAVESNHIIQSVMSRHKFHKTLRYLHVCSLDEQRHQHESGSDYEPVYKVM